MLPKVLFIIMNVHPTSFKEAPKLSPSIMFQMSMDFKLLVQVKHAGREELAQALNISQCEIEFAIHFGLVHALFVYLLYCADQKGRELVLDVLDYEVLDYWPGFKQLFS